MNQNTQVRFYVKKDRRLQFIYDVKLIAILFFLNCCPPIDSLQIIDKKYTISEDFTLSSLTH